MQDLISSLNETSELRQAVFLDENESDVIVKVNLAFRPVREISLSSRIIHDYDEHDEQTAFALANALIRHLLYDDQNPSVGVADPSAYIAYNGRQTLCHLIQLNLFSLKSKA